VELELVLATDEWRFRPVLIDGQPTPVCTAVAFNDSQR
jgi:hypothetical protein